MKTRVPVETVVGIEALVLGGYERFREDHRNLMKRDAVVEVPLVLIGDGKKLSTPIDVSRFVLALSGRREPRGKGSESGERRAKEPQGA
jgi:hypothetical protein